MLAIVQQRRDQLPAICRRHHVRRLDLFGSAASGEGHEAGRSDLDFLVEFVPGRDLGPWLSHYFELKAELEQLFECPVDLVMSSAVRSPYFAREVNRTRIPLYAAEGTQAA